jgi:quinol monooxygenase YgiN
MSEVIVVVILQAKPGAGPTLQQLMAAGAQATHQEAGCLTYALHTTNDEPDRVVLVERWIDQTALDAHMQQPYLRSLFATLEDVLMAPPMAALCSALPAGDPVKGSLAGVLA